MCLLNIIKIFEKSLLEDLRVPTLALYMPWNSGTWGETMCIPGAFYKEMYVRIFVLD